MADKQTSDEPGKAERAIYMYVFAFIVLAILIKIFMIWRWTNALYARPDNKYTWQEIFDTITYNKGFTYRSNDEFENQMRNIQYINTATNVLAVFLVVVIKIAEIKVSK